MNVFSDFEIRIYCGTHCLKTTKKVSSLRAKRASTVSKPLISYKACVQKKRSVLGHKFKYAYLCAHTIT